MKKVSLIAGVLSLAAMTAALWSMPAVADESCSSCERVAHDKWPGADTLRDNETNNTSSDQQTGATGVPEPGMLALFALGLGGLGFAALGRRRARA
jgi:hypothetical protein